MLVGAPAAQAACCWLHGTTMHSHMALRRLGLEHRLPSIGMGVHAAGGGGWPYWGRQGTDTEQRAVAFA
jgi:hypothetical protein